MTVLIALPHPDDESFGLGPAVARMTREGHDVHLLTLTKGGATKQREKYGLSVEEMGERREAEMQDVAEAYGLASLTVLDFPDGGLVSVPPQDLERVVLLKARAVRPDVVVTYNWHGNSLHPDHIEAHAVVKRAYARMHEEDGAKAPRRLALFTLLEGELDDAPEHLTGTPLDECGALLRFTDEDRETTARALACYETYQDVVEAHDPTSSVEDGVAFVLWGEEHDEPLGSLTDDLHDEGE